MLILYKISMGQPAGSMKLNNNCFDVAQTGVNEAEDHICKCYLYMYVLGQVQARIIYK